MLFKTYDTPTLCEIHQGDCLQVIAENHTVWRKAFDFVFADPPFNIGQEYDEHNDKMSEGEFEEFILASLGFACDLLRESGIFVVHVPDEMVHLALLGMPVNGFDRVDWIIWHYRFGECQDTKFIRSKNHALVFRKYGDAPHTFNAHDILVESDRATKYNDSRTLLTANPGKRVPLDVWDEFPRVTGNSKERVPNHPNQLPELYLARLIRAYSNPGDYVFDPFGGTGTTAVVARALGRHVVTTELSLGYCADIAERIEKGAVRL